MNRMTGVPQGSASLAVAAKVDGAARGLGDIADAVRVQRSDG